MTKLFSGGRLVLLGVALVFSTAELAQAAPPRIYRSIPNRIGPPIGHPGPYYRPYHGFLYYGYPYPYYYGGYSGYRRSYERFSSDDEPALYVPASPVLTAEEKEVAALLTASGVPTNEGRPAWPLALRILPGQEAQALRGQIDSLLQVAASQSTKGRLSSAVVDELAQATDQLRKLLLRHREGRGDLAQFSYDEAGRFLDKLEGAQKLLR